MNEKQKLILKFALDCFSIILLCLGCAIPKPATAFIFILCSALNAISQKLFFSKKLNHKKSGRELTTAEVIAVFTIAFSTLYILIFTEVGRLLHNITLIIPIGIIALAVRLLYFSKELAALQIKNSKTSA
jgi:hypothetical protein